MLEEKIGIYQEGIQRLNFILETQMQSLENLPISDAETKTLLSIENTTNLANINRSIISNELEIANLNKTLTNFPDGSIIEPIEVTTIVESKGWQRSVILALLGSGFLLLIFVFVRAGFRSASKDPESSKKIQRIKSAFGFGGRG